MRLDRSPIGWLVDPRLWLVSVLALTSQRFRSWRPFWSATEIPLFILIPCITLFVTMFGYLAIYYTQGSIAPKRALNALYAIFIIGWVITLVCVVARLELPSERMENAGAVKTIGLFALGLLIITSVNFENALGDVSYVAKIWHPQMTEKFKGHSRVVAFDPNGRQPAMYTWDPISGDPTRPMEKCYKALLGKTFKAVAGPKY